MFRSRRTFFFVTLVAIGGCAESDVQLHPVRGTVLFNDEPVPQAEIVFHPQFEGPGWMPVATADDEGQFSASTKVPEDGALPGSYKVTVVWRPQAIEEGDGPNLLPPRYANPDTSGLEVEVGSETDDLLTLRLKD